MRVRKNLTQLFPDKPASTESNSSIPTEPSHPTASNSTEPIEGQVSDEPSISFSESDPPASPPKKKLPTLNEVITSAMNGDKSALDELDQEMQREPRVIDYIFSNLGKGVEELLLPALVGNDVIRQLAARKKIDILRNELIDEGDRSTSDRLLMEAVVSSYLMLKVSETQTSAILGKEIETGLIGKTLRERLVLDQSKHLKALETMAKTRQLMSRVKRETETDQPTARKKTGVPK